MKDHSPVSKRMYDSDGYRQRGAAVCIRDDKEDEVLLVTSSRDSGKWVIPGGGVEPGEDVKKAAVREVIEEAGVRGSIIRHLGDFKNEQGKHRTSVYVLRVNEELPDWAERKGRQRGWFPVDEARYLLSLHKHSQQIYLDYLKSHHGPPAHVPSQKCVLETVSTTERFADDSLHNERLC